MNILEVVSTRGSSGAVTYARRIVPQLLDRGHKVFLAALPDSWIANELKNTIPVIYTSFARWPLSELKRIADFCKHEDIDFVHSHLTRANHFSALLKLIHKIPSIAHLHANNMESTHWFHDLVIAVSKDTFRRHRFRGVGHGNRGALLYNYVDTDEFQPIAAVNTDPLRELINANSSDPVIVQVGQICGRKGQDVTIAALPTIWKIFPSARMVFIGEGNPIHTNDSRVSWLGRREDVHKLLPAATIALQPSRVEPFGLAVVEAMACKVPVVASSVGGLQEIAEGGSMVLVPANNPAELAHAVIKLLSDEDLRLAYIEKAFLKVLTQFGANAHMNQLEKLFSQVILKKS